MIAVATHTFAGGMAIGVRDAGFDVIRAQEPLGFGVQTLEMLGIPALVAPPPWPRRPKPDLVFGNPRCGGFSALGSNVATAKSRGVGCQQGIDFRQLIDYGVNVAKAPYVVAESVPALPMKFRGFLDDLIREFDIERRYRVAHVFQSAACFGNAQYRKRYFFVLYPKRKIFDVALPNPPAKMVTVKDVIGKFLKRKAYPVDGLKKKYPPEYDGDAYRYMGHREDIYPYLRGGETANHLYHMYGAEFFKDLPGNFYEKALNARSDVPFGVAGAEFSLPRLRWDGPCPTLIGHCSGFIHPIEDRALTIRELAALMGWPPNEIPVGSDPGAQLAKGVVPACGKWIAEGVAASMADEWEEDLSWHVTKTGEVKEAPAKGLFEKIIDVSLAVPKKIQNVWRSMHTS